MAEAILRPGMPNSLPRDGTLIVTQRVLDECGADLYERFVRLSEKYQYRDLGRAVADAIRAWVETHEHSDTGRPPAIADATLQESALEAIRTPPPPAIDDGDSGPKRNRS